MEYLFWWRQLFLQSLIILWHQAFWQLTTIPPPKDRKYLSAEEYFSLRSFKGHIAWFALRGCFWKGGKRRGLSLRMCTVVVVDAEESWIAVVPCCVACNLHPFSVQVLTGGPERKATVLHLQLFQFLISASELMLPLCKLEAELIMKKASRSQDPILTGITLNWLCSAIEVKVRRETLHIYSWSGSVCISLLHEDVVWMFYLQFELDCSKWRAVSWTVKPF